MATATITLQSICGGQGHVTIAVIFNGGPARALNYTTDELRSPITQDEIQDAVKVLVRLHCQGMTRVQARNALQQGIDVVTS